MVLRWVVVGVVVVMVAVRTAYEWDRGELFQTRRASSYPDERYVEGQRLMLMLINQQRDLAVTCPHLLYQSLC